MTRHVWITVACIILCIGLFSAWRLWRYWSLYSTLAEMSQAEGLSEPLAPDSRHLAAIRKLRFTWDTMVENGGPTVIRWRLTEAGT